MGCKSVALPEVGCGGILRAQALEAAVSEPEVCHGWERPGVERSSAHCWVVLFLRSRKGCIRKATQPAPGREPTGAAFPGCSEAGGRVRAGGRGAEGFWAAEGSPGDRAALRPRGGSVAPEGLCRRHPFLVLVDSAVGALFWSVHGARSCPEIGRLHDATNFQQLDSLSNVK